MQGPCLGAKSTHVFKRRFLPRCRRRAKLQKGGYAILGVRLRVVEAQISLAPTRNNLGTKPACLRCLPRTNPVWARRFRGALILKARGLVYHSTLGLRVIQRKETVARSCASPHACCCLWAFEPYTLHPTPFTLDPQP